MDKILQYFIGYDPLIFSNIFYSILMILAYIVICLIVPSWFLYPYLKEKSFAYRIMAYQIASNIYINLFSFVLAYLGIFNSFTVWLFVIIVPVLVVMYINKRRLPSLLKNVKEVFSDILLRLYGTKMLIRMSVKGVKGYIKKIYAKYIKNKEAEVFILFSILVCVFMFFGSLKFSLEGYRYAAADEEVHLFWINSLLEGDAFPRGLYPHALHFLVATLVSFFSIPVIEGYLAFAPVIIIMILFNFYFILRELFNSRFAPLAGIAIYAIADFTSVHSYERYFKSLPMDFGVLTVIATIYFVIKYVKNPDKPTWYLVIASLVLSVYTHFFDAIFIIFLCVPLAVFLIWTIMKKKLVKNMVIGGLIAVVLALAPFGVGLALGYPFEQSMDWAMSVISSSVEEEEETVIQEDTSEEVIEEEKTLEELFTGATGKLSLFLYKNSMIATVMIILNALMFLYGLIIMIFFKRLREKGMMYMLFSSFLFVLIFLYLCAYFGLPVIVMDTRCASIGAIFSIPVWMFLFNVVDDFLSLIFRNKFIIVKNSLNALMVVALIAGLFITGNLHYSRYYSSTLTRTEAIIAKYLITQEEKNTWTAITTTNSLTLIGSNGYHYELIDIIEHIHEGEEEIYIPTQNIYIIAEIDAKGYNYPIYLEHDLTIPQPIYISADLALDDSLYEAFDGYAEKRSVLYQDYRQHIMSHIYFWVQKLSQVYPDEVTIAYQDSEAVVYKIEQDPYFLLNLSVDYLSDLEG